MAKLEQHWMLDGRHVPRAVVEAIDNKFQDRPSQFISAMQDLKFDNLNQCWYFHFAGMYIGVEEDGYIHT